MRPRAALLGLLVGTALAVPTGPAAAAACADRSAVTVVVDFASLGGGEQTRCTRSDPASGLAALRAAGFAPTRAAQQPGYFVCRIDGKPANDPCQRTSPADAYWSYWHAQRGGSWTYSSAGAADYDPPPGSVEGWAFGAGKPPSSPPPPRAAAPAPSRTATPRPTSPPPAASPTTAAAPASSAARVTSTAPTAPAATSAAPAATTPVANASPSSPSAQPSPNPTPTVLADLPPPTPARSRRSGPLLAAVLVGALVAAAVTTGVRRRRQAGD